MSRSWTYSGIRRESPQSTNPFGAPSDGWLAPSRIALLVTTTVSVASVLALTSYRPDTRATGTSTTTSTPAANPGFPSDRPQVAGTSVERSEPYSTTPVMTVPIRCAGDDVVIVVVEDDASGEPLRRIPVCGPGVIGP